MSPLQGPDVGGGEGTTLVLLCERWMLRSPCWASQGCLGQVTFSVLRAEMPNNQGFIRYLRYL